MEKVLKEKKYDKMSYLIIGLVALLLVFSIVQAFQIDAIEDKISISSNVLSKVATSGTQASQARTPAPAMVGGC